MKRPHLRDIAYRDKREWFRVVFRLKGSVIPAVMPRVALCVGFALVIAALHTQGVPVSIPVLGSLVPSIVLGLLLVFRTNTAYERFWEGRKLWGNLINTNRNLARQIWVAVQEHTPHDRTEKAQALRLLVAFAIATKQHLRGDPLGREFSDLVTPIHMDKLHNMNHPPLEVAFWLADYLQAQHYLGKLNTYQLTSMTESLDELVHVLGGCERILRTPIPLAYSIHLKQLLMIYCLALPFQMVAALSWWTALIVGLISFAVFGIEEIGIEIENPFGHDPNDLPLDDICRTMRRNVEDLISLSPSASAQQWQVS